MMLFNQRYISLFFGRQILEFLEMDDLIRGEMDDLIRGEMDDLIRGEMDDLTANLKPEHSEVAITPAPADPHLPQNFDSPHLIDPQVCY